MKYIIKDWSGNVLSHKGHFAPNYLYAPLQFDSFDDGWDWIYTNVENDCDFEDLYVVAVICA